MKIPILMYHQIDQPPKRGTNLRGLIVSPQSFARQMAFLKLLGFKGLSMQDLLPYLQGQKTGKVVGLTFDDGYKNNVQNALPVIVKNGFTATCYGVSSMIGGTNSWDQGKVAEKPLMTLADWQTWRNAGMDVGSHTRHHSKLTELSDDEARTQIVESKRELEQSLECSVNHFCYPYGAFNSAHRDMAALAGYVTATTTQRGRVEPGADAWTLKRIMIARATTLIQFAAKIMTTYEDRRA